MRGKGKEEGTEEEEETGLASFGRMSSPHAPLAPACALSPRAQQPSPTRKRQVTTRDAFRPGAEACA